MATGTMATGSAAKERRCASVMTARSSPGRRSNPIGPSPEATSPEKRALDGPASGQLSLASISIVETLVRGHRHRPLGCFIVVGNRCELLAPVTAVDERDEFRSRCMWARNRPVSCPNADGGRPRLRALSNVCVRCCLPYRGPRTGSGVVLPPRKRRATWPDQAMAPTRAQGVLPTVGWSIRGGRGLRHSRAVACAGQRPIGRRRDGAQTARPPGSPAHRTQPSCVGRSSDRLV